MGKTGLKCIQWHPYFVLAATEVYRKYGDKIRLTPELELSQKPLRIDLLIIKKEEDVEVEDSIGQLFRRYNVIEFKSPEDYLAVNDYYKCVAYIYLYKTLSSHSEPMDIGEMTLTMISAGYPMKMFSYLAERERLTVEKKAAGIYYLTDHTVPIQVAVLNEVDDPALELLMLFSTNQNFERGVRTLLQRCSSEPDNDDTAALLELSFESNPTRTMEVAKMSIALSPEERKRFIRLFKEMDVDLISEVREEGIQKGIQKGIQEGKQEGILEGRYEGIREAVFTILNKKFATVPLGISEKIKAERDPAKLNIILSNAVTAATIEEFKQSIET